MPEAGYGFLPSGSRNFWLVAPCWGEGGQETQPPLGSSGNSAATQRFWETGFPTSHYHKLMDYISEKNMIYFLDALSQTQLSVQ